MYVSSSKWKVVAIGCARRVIACITTVFKRMLIPSSKRKVLGIVLRGCVVVVFVGLLIRDRAVSDPPDVSINNHVWDVWRTTVVKAANDELARIRQIAVSDSYESPQNAQVLMEAYDASFNREVAMNPLKFGGVGRVRKSDQKYPRAQFLQMILDKGVTIEDATDYLDLLSLRLNLLSAEDMFFHGSTEEQKAGFAGDRLPSIATWDAYEEAEIQGYLELFYFAKEAEKDPYLAWQMDEGIFMFGRAKDGTPIPMRTDTTYFQLDSDGEFDFGDMVWPAMDFDVEAIHKHLQPYPFAEKLPKHVKIGFLGPDGKPAEAPRRGMAKLWGRFADIFDDDEPTIARSESEAALPIQAELQPANASEPEPVSRTLPDTVVANPDADDSKPQPTLRHAVPELEIPEFPTDLEKPEPASVIPSEIENQMKPVEDWKFPDGVDAEELERFLESLEDIIESTSIPDAPDYPEILDHDKRYEDRGDPNGNRDEFDEEQEESDRERREPPEMEPQKSHKHFDDLGF